MERLEPQRPIRSKDANLTRVRESYLSFISMGEGENNFEQNSIEAADLDFRKTPIQLVLSKFCDNSINEYVFHTRIYLEYDEEDAFIFVFKSSLVFTHLFEENETELKENPIIYIIKFQQIYFYDHTVNESDGNFIILQFYENDFIKKSEIKLNFNFLKDSYFIHHFIKKYFILHWQRTFESAALQTGELNSLVYNYHFYVKKMNRWGKNQDRLLLVTDKFLLNIVANFKKDNQFKVEKIRWADSIQSITKVGIIQNKMTELRIYYDNNINKEEHKNTFKNKKYCKGKKSRDFMFLNDRDKNYFLFLMKKNFYSITNKFLVLEGIKIS